ncbi:hypothetical protein HA402_011493 [Bradysia odoriphaga]|nr:hypothetical protein HA402_011493 [Bradysia odoriphaga]
MSTNSPKLNKFSIKSNKNTLSANRIPKTDQNKPDSKNVCKEQSTSDDILTKMAVAEILKETSKGAIRAEQVGPSGWLPCPLMKTNKRFLRNTIKSVISHNRSNINKPKKSNDELDEIIRRGQKRKAKFGERKHCFRRPRPTHDRDSESGTSSRSQGVTDSA